MVVDDDVDVRTLLQRALGAEGFDVEAVDDGQSARRSMALAPPDLVVLDLSLGGEDGLDVLGALRKDGDIPVILLTGRGAEHDRVLGLKLGADDYLVKPFSPVELAARITSVLRRAGRSAPPPSLEHGADCWHATFAIAAGEPVRLRTIDLRVTGDGSADTAFATNRKIPHVDDLDVWSVWCVRVRPGHRGKGISHALLAGAVAFAAESGAPAIEGYPVDNRGGKVDLTMAYVGTRSLFEQAGFTLASRTEATSAGFPRVVMRRDLG